jgi:hypothetical protein
MSGLILQLLPVERGTTPHDECERLSDCRRPPVPRPAGNREPQPELGSEHGCAPGDTHVPTDQTPLSNKPTCFTRSDDIRLIRQTPTARDSKPIAMNRVKWNA